MEPGHSQVPMSGMGSLPSTLAPDLILAPQACIVIGAYWGKRMPEWEWPWWERPATEATEAVLR